MRHLRNVALLLFAVLAFYACSERASSVSDVTRPHTISIVPRYSILGGSSFDPISRIILTARRTDTNAVVAVDTFDVSDQASWEIDFSVPADAGVVTILVELLDASGEIEWSGMTAPIRVEPGTTSTPAPVTLVQGPPQNLTVTSVTITPPNASVVEGTAVSLSAAITGGAPGAVAIWSSLDPAVAIVDGNGLVNTVRNGLARIVAVAGPRADTAFITVAQRVASITVTPDTQRIGNVGGEAQFTARVLDPRGAEINTAAVTWGTANNAIASHLGNGRFRANATGVTSVTAISTSDAAISGSATLIVTQRVARVVVTPSTASLNAIGSTQPFTAAAEDAAGNRMAVAFTWRSSTPAVATVDAAGVATAVAVGTTEITAVSGAGTPDSIVGRASLQVTQTIRAIEITPPSAALSSIGDTVRFTAIARDGNNNVVRDARLEWSSSNEAVATVTPEGLVRAVGPGSAEIRAAAGATRGTAVVGVAQVVNTVEVTPSSFTLTGAGQTVRLTAIARDRNGQEVSARRTVWSSSNSAAATVDSTGLVTAIANGSTTITAAVEGMAGTASITVQLPVPVGPPTMTRVAGNAQTGVVGTLLPDTLKVRVNAVNGSPLAGVVVRWVVTTGNGSVNPDSSTTDATGTALTQWTLGTSSTSGQQVEARAVGVTGSPLMFTATANAGTVARVVISPDTLRLSGIGATAQFAAALFDQHNNTATGIAAWSSLDPAVASVDANGQVTATGAGTARIVASVNPADTAYVVVTLAPPNLVIRNVSVLPADTIELNDSITVSVTVKNIGNSSAGASITALAVLDASSNGPVLDVDTVIATPPLAAGDSVVLTFRGLADDLEGWPDSVRIGALADVNNDVAESDDEDNGGASDVRYIRFGVDHIVFSESFLQFSSIGDTIHITATAHDVNTRQLDVPVVLSVRDTVVATVDEAGNVVARAAGLTMLYASGGGVNDSTPVLVQQEAVRLEVTPDSVMMNALQDTTRLIARAYDARNNVIARTIPLFSINPDVAFVLDTLGNVVSQGAGTAKVVAQTWRSCDCAPLTDTTIVVVQQVIRSVAIDADSILLFMGDTARIFALARDSNDVIIPGAVFTWSSADTQVVVVDSTGKVTAQETPSGRTYVKATLGAHADSLLVRVAGPSSVTKLWRGNLSADWATPGNWSPSSLPTSADTILIRAAAPNMPTLSANQQVGGVFIDEGATLNIGAHTLSVYGGIFNSGALSGAGTLELRGNGSPLFAAAVPNLSVIGTIGVVNPLTINGNLTISGNFNVNQTTVHVTGHLSTVNDVGRLFMHQAGAEVMVDGNATFDGGDHSGALTLGTLTIKGNFVQQQPCGYGNSDEFRATGAHKTVFAGAAAQTVSFGCAGDSHFQNLEINNPAGVTFLTNAIVQGAVDNIAGVTAGNVSIVIGNGLTDTDLRWRLATTQFINAIPQLPDSIQSTTLFTGLLALPSDFKVIGNASVLNGAQLVVGPHKLVVTGDFGTYNDNTILNMTDPASRVEVWGNVVFDGADHTGYLTAGTLTLKGHFAQQQPCGYGNSDEFNATGTHTTVFAGTNQQVMFGCAAASRFRNLEIRSGSTVTLSTYAAATGNALIEGTLTGANTMEVNGDITAPAGATLSVTGLTVGGVLSAASAVYDVPTTTFNGSDQTIAPALNYNGVYVLGSAALSGTTVFEGDLSVRGMLDLAGQALTVNGSFATTNDQGLIVMQAPAGTLTVNGNAMFDGGDHTGYLTAGTLTVKGNFTQQQPCGYGNSDEFNATGTHKLVLGGTTGQLVAFGCASASRIQELEINNAAGVAFQTDFIVNGRVDNVSGQTTGNVSAYIAGGLTDSDLRWRVATTRFTAPATVLPDSMQTTVVFSGNTILPHALKLIGDLDIRAGAQLTIGPNRLIVTGNFGTRDDNGILNMTDPGAQVDVAGHVTFDGADLTGHLTAGTLTVGGNFSQQQPCGYGNSDEFNATGTHTTIFNGTAQTVSFGCATASRFRNLQVLTGSTVTLQTYTVATGDVAISGGMTGGNTLEVGNNLTAPAGATLSMAGLTIGGTISADAASYDIPLTTFTGANQTILPALNYEGVTVTGTAALTGNTAFNGNLRVRGRLDVGAHALQITGSLSTIDDIGLFVMQNAAGAVTVDGNAVFDGGDHTGYLTAGTLTVKGNFQQQQPCGYGNSDEFNASGTHKLALNGTTLQAVSFGCFSSSHIQNLELNNAAGFAFNTDVYVNGEVTALAGQANGAVTATLGGLVDVNELWRVANTTFYAAPSSLPDTMYSKVRLTGTYTLPHDFTVQANNLEIRGGANLIVGPNTLTVNGHFIAGDDNGILTMTHDSSLVIISGNATFDGGDHSTALTAGVLKIGGNFWQQQPCGYGNSDEFEASGTHKTVMTGQGSISFGCYTESRFNDLQLLGPGPFTFGSQVAVGGVLTSQGPRTISSTNSSTLYVTGGVLAHDLTIDGLLVELAGTITQFDNNTFGAFNTGNTQLKVTQSSGTVNMSGLTFNTTPTTGYYINMVGAGTLNLSGTSPANHAGRVQGNITGWSYGPHHMTVAPSSLSFATLFRTANLTATVYDDANNQVAATVNWTSTDTAVAAVDAGGVVTAISNGTAKIIGTAPNGGVSPADTTSVTIAQYASTFTVPGRLTLAAGDTFRLSVTARDSLSNDVAKTYVSRNTALATVDATGKLTLATVVDDSTYIVITAGTRTDSTFIRVTAPPNVTRIWTGGSSDWSNAANWSGNVVPGNTDVVWIRSDAANQPALSANADVAGIVVDNGASVSVGTFVLMLRQSATVSGSVTATTGKVQLLGTGSFSGTLPKVDVDGSWTASARSTINGTVTINNGGSFSAGGQYVRVNGDITLFSTGTLPMTNAADTIDVSGNVHLNRTDGFTPAYNAGVLKVQGNFSTGGNSNETFRASGTHTVILDGSGMQTVSLGINDGSHYFNRIIVSNPDSVKFTSTVYIADGVLISAGKVVGTGTAHVANHITDAAGDRWRVAYTRVYGATPTLPTSMRTILFLNTAVSPQTDFAVDSLRIDSGGTLDANGRTITVRGDFNLFSTGVLTMDGAADVLDVHGNFYLNRTDGFTPTYSAGLIKVKGNFTTGGNSNESFQASGTHTVRLYGTGMQTVTMGISGVHYLRRLEVSNPDSVKLATNLIVTDGVTITDGKVVGNVTATLGNYLADALSDRWRVAFTRFTGAGPSLPASAKTILLVSLTNAPTTDFAVDSIRIESGGTLDVNGRTITVRGDFNLFSTGVLTMDGPSDVLDVQGNFFLNRTDGFTPTYSAGWLKVRGNFATGGNSNESFRASGTHTVRLNGTGMQTVTLGIADGNHYFRRIEIDNPDSVKFASNVYVADGVTITNGLAVGTVTATLGNYITDAVSDRWRVAFTRFSGAGPALPASMKTALLVDGGNNNSPTTDFAVDSMRIDNGGVFDPNGHTITVRGNFTVVSSGVLRMDSTADVVDVGGSVFINRTDGFTPTYSAGLLKVKGNFATGGNSNESFQASGTHKVLFNGVSAQTITMGIPAAHYFAHVEVSNAAGATFATTTNLSGSLGVLANATLGVGGGTTVSVNGNLTWGANTTLNNSGTLRYHGTQTGTPANQNGPAPVLY